MVKREDNMERIKNYAFDESMTYVVAENEEISTNPTNHDFKIKRSTDDSTLCNIHFQEGPIGSDGVNGILNENLLVILIDRIESFQKSKLACRENENALAKLYEALWWLNKRNYKKNFKK